MKNSNRYKIAAGMLLALSLTKDAFCQSSVSHGSASPAIDLNKIKVELNTTDFAQKTERQVNRGIPSEPWDEIILLNGQAPSIRILFDGEKVDYDNSYKKKHLLVFPLKQYADLYRKESDRRQTFAEYIDRLKKIIARGTADGVQEIPIFPWCDAAQLIHTQEHIFRFKNGAGVSFIACYGNGDAPLTESSQFYSFQGLTDDGRFYISFFAPVKTPGLPAGAPMNQGLQILSKIKRNNFRPSLDVMDNMLKTLSVK